MLMTVGIVAILVNKFHLLENHFRENGGTALLSQLAYFLLCPFNFFSQALLGLVRAKYGMNDAIRGAILHV